MVDISLTLILQAVNYAALLFVLYFLIIKPVIKLLDERALQIKGDLDEAKRKNQDANNLLDEYQEKIASIQKEAEVFMENTKQEAAFEREKILRQAEEKSSSLLERTRKEIHEELEIAKADLKKDFSKTAIFCAEKIIEKEIDAKKHKEIINQFLESEFV